MPISTEHYIHRVGRTARAGRAGISVSLAGEKERKIVKDIIKNAENAVKNRIIPPEIIEKYKKKLANLEPEIRKLYTIHHSYFNDVFVIVVIFLYRKNIGRRVCRTTICQAGNANQ